MKQYKFLSGEVYAVLANDEQHAREIIDAFFTGEYPTDSVSEDNIDRVESLDAMTIMLEEE